MNLDNYFVLLACLEDHEDLRIPFKKPNSKDFIPTLSSITEFLYMNSWSNFFTPYEQNILSSKRKDQDYLSVILESLAEKHPLDHLLSNLKNLTLELTFLSILYTFKDEKEQFLRQ
jgi:hypothetical protein